MLEVGVPSRGDAIRDVEETTELGLGGGRYGVAWRSGVPFA